MTSNTPSYAFRHLDLCAWTWTLTLNLPCYQVPTIHADVRYHRGWFFAKAVADGIG